MGVYANTLYYRPWNLYSAQLSYLSDSGSMAGSWVLFTFPRQGFTPQVGSHLPLVLLKTGLFPKFARDENEQKRLYTSNVMNHA